MTEDYFKALTNKRIEPTVEDCVNISIFFNVTTDYLLGLRSKQQTIVGTQNEDMTDLFLESLRILNTIKVRNEKYLQGQERKEQAKLESE